MEGYYTTSSNFPANKKDAFAVLQSPAAVFTATGVAEGAEGHKENPIHSDHTVGQTVILAGYVKDIEVHLSFNTPPVYTVYEQIMVAIVRV